MQRALGYWLLPEPQPAPLGADLQPPVPLATGARAIRLPRSEWEATARVGGIGALLNALQRLALYAAVSGRAPVIPSVPCVSRWISRNAFGRSGVADDYILQLANATLGGFQANGDDGGIECHLALGGQACMLPTVLPAWSRAKSGSVAFLQGAAPEAAAAVRIVARLVPSRHGASAVDVSGGATSGGATSGGATSGGAMSAGVRCGRAGRRLALQP